MAITLDANVQAIVTAALEQARARRHREVTLEHLLLAMLRDVECARLLAGCGADVAELERDVMDYLELVEEDRSGRAHRERPDAAYEAVIAATARRTAAAQRDRITAGHLLASLAGHERAYAAVLLAAAGVERIDILRYAAHGTRDSSVAELTDLDTVRVIMHNDDFTTMEFVVQVLREEFGLGEKDALEKMLAVHKAGRADLGRWPVDAARERVRRAIAAAEIEEFPLRFTFERA